MQIVTLRRVALLAVIAALVSVMALPRTGISAVQAQDRKIVNVYSSRHYGAMEAVFVKFTEETGIEVRISQGSAQSLVTRLEAEGEQTPADVFFSIDAGGATLLANNGLLSQVESDVLKANIPADLRDPDGRWFGVGQRFRSIVYNPAKVKPEELSTYEGLADPQWKGRLCLRPATHIYTISLVASMIAALGEEKAEAVVKGWVANQPQMIDSDTRILETIAAGGCDVGITNHYYLARKISEDAQFPVKLFWANQADRGVHRNISVIGVTTNAVNRENAIKLIEWLSEAEKGQSADISGLAGSNWEFPVNVQAKPGEIISGFGTFKIDTLDFSKYGEFQQKAIDLLGRAGY